MLEHYDKILEETRLSLQETMKIQDSVEQELDRIRYSRKTLKPMTFEQLNKEFEVSGPPPIIKHDSKK